MYSFAVKLLQQEVMFWYTAVVKCVSLPVVRAVGGNRELV